MSRRFYDEKTLFKRLKNLIMKDGKQRKAENILMQVCMLIKQNMKTDPIPVIESAIRNCIPFITLKNKKIAGKNYVIPWHLKDERAEFLGTKWLIEAARNRAEHASSKEKYMTISKQLYLEIIEAYQNKGNAIKKKNEVYSLALKNRPFLKFVK